MRNLLLLLLVLTPLLLSAQGADADALKYGSEAEFYKAKAAAGGVITSKLREFAVERIKKSGYTLQQAVDRYFTDRAMRRNGMLVDGTGNYPVDIAELAAKGYFSEPGPYRNPVTSDGKKFDARQVPLGWSKEAPGNFSYLIQRGEDGRAVAYMLVIYGLARDAHHDWDLDGDGKPDGAVLVLTSRGGPEFNPEGQARLTDMGREVVVQQWLDSTEED